MREYKNFDGSKVIIGSLAQIDARFGLTQKPQPIISILPVFNADQLPLVLVLPPERYSRENHFGQTPRSVAQGLADQTLRATFGQVALLDDQSAVAEVVQDANENIGSIHILFGTKLIDAGLAALTRFAETLGLQVRNAERMKTHASVLPTLVNELWQQQAKAYASSAFGSFHVNCNSAVAAERLSTSQRQRPYGIWCPSPPPAGEPLAASQFGFDPRQFQN